MGGWICDGIPKNGKKYPNFLPHEPFENLSSQTSCCECGLPREAAGKETAVPDSSDKSIPLSGNLVGIFLFLLVSGGLGYLGYHSFKFQPIVVLPTPTPILSPGSNTILDDRSSSGDRPLFKDGSASYLNEGTEFFEKQNYNRAIESFEEAVEATPNQPEPTIYLNNSIARCQNKPPYVIAAVVPITHNPDQAKEMLRGIADSQTQFNQSSVTRNKSLTQLCGGDDRLLEVQIVDDGNDPKIATQVSEALSEDSKILAVIGHNSSDASKAAMVNYEFAGLAMISPTSSSTYLQGSTFFRTLPSDEKSGKKLAEYVNQKVNGKDVAIFYTSTSSYSVSLRKAFVDNYQGNTPSFDFDSNNFDPDVALQSLKENNLSVVVLFPDVKQRDKAINLANAAKDQNIQLTFFGGDALYAPETLREARSSLEGMVLVVPWFEEVQDDNYAKQADERWQGQVSWRTAMSYDAAQAVANVISDHKLIEKITREDVIKSLHRLNLSSSQTSGNFLSFDENGDRKIDSRIVQIVFGGQNRPEGADHRFILVPFPDSSESISEPSTPDPSSESSPLPSIRSGGQTSPLSEVSHYEGQVQTQLEALKLLAGLGDYKQTHAPYINFIEGGMTENLYISLNAGVNYSIVGVCDEDCIDLDFVLYDDNGNEIGIDRQVDSFPLVEVTPKWSATFRLRVDMYQCNQQPCYFGVGVFGNNNSNKLVSQLGFPGN